MQNKTIILHSSAKVIHSLAIIHRIHHQLAGFGIAIKHMSHSFICHAMIYPGIAIKKTILGQNIVCFLCYYLSELQSAARRNSRPVLMLKAGIWLMGLLVVPV